MIVRYGTPVWLVGWIAIRYKFQQQPATYAEGCLASSSAIFLVDLHVNGQIHRKCLCLFVSSLQQDCQEATRWCRNGLQYSILFQQVWRRKWETVLAVALMFFGMTKQKYHVPPDHHIYAHLRTKLFEEKQVKKVNLISKRSLPFPEAHSAFCWSHLLYNCLKLIIQLDVDVLFRPALNWSTWGTAWKTYDANKQPAKWSHSMMS